MHRLGFEQRMACPVGIYPEARVTPVGSQSEKNATLRGLNPTAKQLLH